MDCSVQELDELCARLDRLAAELAQPPSSVSSVSQQREEQAAVEVVQIIQRIGENIAWAYGQSHRPGIGEAFAQPFVDRRSRDRLRALLADRQAGRRPHLRNRVAAQVLQTIHILLQATPPDSTLFCNLTAGWYLNDVVATRLDFRDNEDLLPLWMTVVKDIAIMLSKENMMLFFDPSSPTPFPIFSEAMRFYHHPVSQVRTHVQAASLEIFLKLRDEDFWGEPLFQLVLLESSSFFTHVCCLLREIWRLADDAFRSGAKRDLRSALCIQNDIVLYLNDVFACDIPRLREIVQEKLLRFAILPVLLRSIVLRRPSVAARMSAQQSDTLSAPVAVHLLHDLLATLRNTPVLEAIASVFMRPEVPEEVLHLVSAAPPRTPSAYYAIQVAWGGSAKAGAFDHHGDTTADEVLYAMPPLTLVERLRRPGSIPSSMARGWPLDALEEWLRDLDAGAEATGLAGSLLSACARLLEAQRASREALDSAVAERLGSALSQVLSNHQQLQWCTLSASFAVLRDLAVATESSIKAKHILIAPLRERVLVPLAGELLQMLKRYGREVQEAWAQEFRVQWNSGQALLWEPPSPSRQRERLAQPQQGEPPALREGRARCVRVFLGASRLKATWERPGEALEGFRLPGVPAEGEEEELTRYRPGTPVHVGKQNRVKCFVRGLGVGGAEDQHLYLMPASSSMVLVRTHEQKPFWAVPVVCEPLASLRLRLEGAQQPAGEESERSLQLEVVAPQSPLLRDAAQASMAAGPMAQDRMSATMAGPVGCGGGMYGGAGATAHDRMAITMPGAPNAMAMPGAQAFGGVPCSGVARLTLVFSDDRRRRVAAKILAQARHAVYTNMLEGLGALLEGELAGSRGA